MRDSIASVRLIYWSIAIPAFAGVCAYLTIFMFPIVRFVASNDWISIVTVLFVPVIFALCFLQILILYWDADKADAFFARQRKKRGAGKPEESKYEKEWRLLVAIVAGPPVLWALYCLVLISWAPMISMLVSRDAVTLDFIVSEKRRGAGRRWPDSLAFEGHPYLVGGLHHPPGGVWDTAEAGDLIRLKGSGNRCGVFYSEIELIKQE